MTSKKFVRVLHTLKYFFSMPPSTSPQKILNGFFAGSYPVSDKIWNRGRPRGYANEQHYNFPSLISNHHKLIAYFIQFKDLETATVMVTNGFNIVSFSCNWRLPTNFDHKKIIVIIKYLQDNAIVDIWCYLVWTMKSMIVRSIQTKHFNTVTESRENTKECQKPTGH